MGKRAQGLAVEVVGLTKHYVKSHFFKKTVSRGVEDLSLTVQRGEVFGLLGLNGAGKTTLMKLLVGLIYPDRGRISLLGGDPGDPTIMARFGYLPELPYLNLQFTAAELLEHFGRLYGLSAGARRERATRVLDMVRIGQAATRRLSEYSKGMLQRVALAQALIHDPDLIFLDEPMSGLDPLGYKEMRDILLSLRRQGKTLFFNSHLLEEVEKLCDRVGVMVEGRLAEQKEIARILKKHKTLEEFFLKTVRPGPAVVRRKVSGAATPVPKNPGVFDRRAS